ncbi:glycoside hydrolase family 28 protein [Alkalitalea saponilacus]|uniref:Glycosyl hydrolases family 28 n=1 Tax=Alkalitalea saponilacus TaxID=889453 RepID=A0A1T5EVF8_9BACT|nr:glycosyl hydrolase family 28 protein [Alkalitalea saponilacus]ASB48011.1 exo-poly-alpha-D-galacturonosidase [Alkalitalea saponilacus]SKB87933.1 Glycosyl hydrolases family 28 [Alkalitalea saponilacus]
MKRFFSILLVALITFGANSQEWLSKVGAQSFPDGERVYRVNDYNDVFEGYPPIASTSGIQAAIDDCAANGGGKVVFDPGVYHTGALFLKDNVNLVIGEGVELRALIGLEYYPEIKTRVAGIEMMWPSGVINILDKSNVAVTGGGLIHAQGKYHWERYWNLRHEYTPQGLRWASDYDCKRVRTIQVSNSTDVTLKGFRVKQAGFWTVHILYSRHVTVNGLTIRNNIEGMGPSTDGVNVDSSSFVHIFNCDVDCNDDNFTVKAGRDADGLRVNIPSEYVYIHDNIARRGGGALVIGSETSGWIRHVKVENMKAIGTNHVMHLKSAFTRGGGIEYIEMDNVQAENVRTFLTVTLNWNPEYSYATLPDGMDEMPEHWKVMLQEVPREQGIATIRNVKLSNIHTINAQTAFHVTGAEESPITGFGFSNIFVQAQRAGVLSHVRDWTMESVTIKTPGAQELDLRNTRRVRMNRVEYK